MSIVLRIVHSSVEILHIVLWMRLRFIGPQIDFIHIYKYLFERGLQWPLCLLLFSSAICYCLLYKKAK
jgi:hypothetical protein